MGVVIKATGTSTDASLHDSIEHAVRAGSACIKAAGIDRNDIDLTLNIGIYRNNNFCEPASAPLVQSGLDINYSYLKGRKSFSLDIINGACGFLNAVQVGEAFLKTTDIKSVLVVSSDVHPSGKEVAGFPFRNIGAAALLEWSDDPRRGFQEILFRTSPDSSEEFESIIDLSAPGARGHVHIRQMKEYHNHLVDFTAGTLTFFYTEYGEKHNLQSNETIFLTSQPVKDFGSMVLETAGVNAKSVECLYDKYGDTNSSALTIAYHESVESGDIKTGDRVVFIGAGAGLTSAVGLYLE
ncbi:MAG: hypothetical protein JXA49_03365 [Actinobacteria bacterium]|nr:hypothetical protein [Actinomycetota bacterium]